MKYRCEYCGEEFDREEECSEHEAGCGDACESADEKVERLERQLEKMRKEIEALKGRVLILEAGRGINIPSSPSFPTTPQYPSVPEWPQKYYWTCDGKVFNDCTVSYATDKSGVNGMPGKCLYSVQSGNLYEKER